MIYKCIIFALNVFLGKNNIDLKPVRENVFDSARSTVRAYWLKQKFFPAPWHFHPEYEIVLILEGEGTRHVGDSIGKFGPGDLVFLSGGLSHVWISDNRYFSDAHLLTQCIVIQFDASIFDKMAQEIPELDLVQKLLNKSKRGIRFVKSDLAMITSLLMEMVFSTGYDKVASLIKLLGRLSGMKYHLLTSGNFLSGTLHEFTPRFQKILQYVQDNFREPISLEKIAGLTAMKRSSFCRYFKDKAGISFVHYLNDIRLCYSAKLLQEEHLSVTEICFESGFTNISNFNRLFLRKYSKAPREYRKMNRYKKAVTGLA